MAGSLKTSRSNIRSLVAAVLVAIVVQHSHAQKCPQPSNLVAPVIVHNSMTFRWDVTKYVPNPVHCTCMSLGDYGESCSSGSTPKVCTINVSGYTRAQSSLGVYTNYTMCVQTQCSTTNFSDPVCRTFRTSPTAPSPPHQVFVDKHSPSSLDVNWRFPVTLNGPLDGYRVRWCQTSRCVMSEQELRGMDKRAFRITGLEPYRQYNVYVSGFNVDANSGNTLYGAETSLSEYTLPTYPSEPSLTFIKVSTSQVNVVVGVPKYPNGPISGYVLTWCPKRRCYGDYIGTREMLMSNAGTQSITGLQPWTEYEVSVKAFNTVPTNGERAYSEDVNATVVPMPYSPPGPQSFKATPLSSTSIKLTWDVPARFNVTPSHYRVFWCTIGDKFCFNQDHGNVREAVVAPLEPYTEYRFMIKALVQFSSPWLNSAVSSVNGRTWAADPGRPEDLRVVKSEATVVAVSWKAPLEPQGPIDGYRVRICPELGTCPPTGLVSRWATLPRTAYNKSFYGIQPYTAYQVQVKAFNNIPDEKTAEGDVAVVAVSTKPSEPSEPRNVSVKTINSTSVQVTWQPPRHKNGPVKGYRVSWWKSGGPKPHRLEDKSSNETVFLQGEASSLFLGGLQPYTMYAVQVARVNTDGNSTWEGAAGHAEGITDPEPSPAPMNVTFNAVKINATTSKLICNWAPPNITTEPTIQGYLLRVCALQEVFTCWTANTTAQKLSHIFEAVPNFEDYVLQVRAYVLNHGRVVAGNAATAETSTDAPNIPPVSNVTATPINSTSLLVQWNPAERVQDLDTVYNVTLLLFKNSTRVTEVFVSDARAVIQDLEAWTEYSVQVSTCLRRGSKSQCGTASVIVVRTPPTGQSTTEPSTTRAIS